MYKDAQKIKSIKKAFILSKVLEDPQILKEEKYLIESEFNALLKTLKVSKIFETFKVFNKALNSLSIKYFSSFRICGSSKTLERMKAFLIDLIF